MIKTKNGIVVLFGLGASRPGEDVTEPLHRAAKENLKPGEKYMIILSGISDGKALENYEDDRCFDNGKYEFYPEFGVAIRGVYVVNP